MNNANSLLFVPGSRPERFDKALEAGADVVIIDLEDAVSPADKDSARAALAAWLDHAHTVLVRINEAETQWFLEDLGCWRTPVSPAWSCPRPSARWTSQRQATLGRAWRCCLIESARGYGAAPCAGAQSKCRAPGFYTITSRPTPDMRCGGPESLPFRTELVLASRLAGIAAG
ncbi:MAG: CoA ester lyase [Propionivibrio sp.]|nr:CoA ester lyase [Propionivibrio sp.]